MKILCIGNSFSQDATRYLQQISNGELFVRNLYIGGCSLETHYNNIINDREDYDYQENGEFIRKITLFNALKEEDWDVVTLQQVSHYSGMLETYEPYLPFIYGFSVGFERNRKVLFHRTWAYSDYSTHEGFKFYDNSRPKMFDAIVEATSKICKKFHLDIIPNGDAIEEARKLPEFDEKTNPITRDGFHLSLDYGRYLAGLVMYKYLTGKNVMEVTFEPENTDHEICQKLKKIAEEIKPKLA